MLIEMRRLAATVVSLGSASMLVAAAGCHGDVVGGTRPIEDDCEYGCEIGHEDSGGSPAATGTGATSGATTSSGQGGSGGEGGASGAGGEPAAGGGGGDAGGMGGAGA
jgi:hypothetical protein